MKFRGNSKVSRSRQQKTSVNPNIPEFPSAFPPWEKEPDYLDRLPREPGPSWQEWIISAALFLITAISATFAGMFYVAGDLGAFTAVSAILRRPGLLLYGLPYSVPLITILLAHEMGHFLACRYYGMRCTPPFFIPLPVSIAGTLGAFIRIKSQFRHKRVLFDVGVAGPLAGFLFALPTLWLGVGLSRLVPKGAFQAGSLSFGEPLIFRFVGKLVLGYLPEKQDMLAHPIAMAAWFGLLATSLNLLPIWQLDGGHIAYAILGRRLQKKVSISVAVALIALSLMAWPIPSYLFFGLLLLIFGARLHFYHPPTLLDEEELGTGRLLVGLVALFIFIISFIPIPISLT